MQEYQFTGQQPQVYMAIHIPGRGTLVAQPGEVLRFDSPPDGLWLPVKKATTPAKESA